ncbi:MAG: hypothetical protein HY599_06750 [Candidatus Omnitrophica bacterium]|nr:hypothetical protein [Candidatus Omnitrophota bacterium]
MRSHLVRVLLCLIVAQPAWADPVADELSTLRQSVQQLTATVQQLSSTVQVQAARIADLERSQTASTPQPAPGAAVGLSRSPAAGGNLSAFNPEIGVLADIVGQLSESSADGEGNDKLSAREMELVFGHPIDPYSRLDVTATFSDFEAASLEEAYITHWGLPGEVKARIGRLRPKIGKASPLHRDSLDTVDEPLVVAQYLGAEGLSRTGVELSGFLPVPWTTVTHELISGVMEGGIGEGGTLFGAVRRRPSYYARLKNFWDISDSSNLELGTTYLTGSKDDDADLEVQALGLDATLVHYVTPTNKLKWQNEIYLQDRDEAVSTQETVDGPVDTLFENNPWGFYSLVDFRLSPRFGIGGRFDYVEPVDINPATLVRDSDVAFGGYLTFYQSEFARWRLQYRHTDFALGGNDNAVFLQGTVAIGVHQHQLQ